MEPVIAVDLSENKLEAAKVFGATHTINGTTANVREAVCGFTGQRGADHVFVAAGRVPAMEQELTLLRRGAHW